ncbi:hypothetical protein [Streptomyces sp. NPDC002054]|uniref:hypothetical protein n=1 Tax=Streptomyces sp. NPDC002054 TaxID=3154663 RepID=UPI003333B2BF
MDRFIGMLGACALAFLFVFLLVLGLLALLPAPVQAAVPDAAIGGAVLVLGLLGARLIARRSR